ncbi:MAG TPA: DUF1330 domain-containing protein [Sphingomicrobium sp.]|nr:DUF1330 domain-containing protein [Sphingomicrobium sp.]
MTPKAYLVAQIRIHDPGGYEAYRSRTRAIVESFGGRFLVRGGALHRLEGEADCERLVIIEFPNLDAAQAFYRSGEYQEIVPHRTANSDGMLLIAEGAPD